MKVIIKSIEEDWDMRKTHPLREGNRAMRLQSGEVLLAMNKRHTMVRIIDSLGGAHTYWADEGQKYDLAKLEEIQTAAIGLRLQRTDHLKAVA